MFSASAIGTSANLVEKLIASSDAQQVRPTAAESTILREAASLVVAMKRVGTEGDVIKLDVSCGVNEETKEIVFSCTARVV